LYDHEWRYIRLFWSVYGNICYRKKLKENNLMAPNFLAIVRATSENIYDSFDKIKGSFGIVSKVRKFPSAKSFECFFCFLKFEVFFFYFPVAFFYKKILATLQENG